MQNEFVKDDDWPARRDRILRVLQAHPDKEFSASELIVPAEIEKKYVRRALTVNQDQKTPISGVRMREYLKPGGSLKAASHWFAWIGSDGKP